MTTIAQLEAHIENLKDRAARIEARTKTYAEYSDMEMLATLHQDIGMFSQELDRMKAEAAEVEATEAAEAEGTITTAQAAYINTLRDETPTIIEQVTPDALALHLREVDAIAARDAENGDRKAKRAARRAVQDRPHTEWLDKATDVLAADLTAWDHATTIDTATLTKEEASEIIDLLKQHYPATTAHPTQKVHPDMPEWGTVLLDPERIN